MVMAVTGVVGADSGFAAFQLVEDLIHDIGLHQGACCSISRSTASLIWASSVVFWE